MLDCRLSYSNTTKCGDYPLMRDKLNSARVRTLSTVRADRVIKSADGKTLAQFIVSIDGSTVPLPTVFRRYVKNVTGLKLLSPTTYADPLIHSLTPAVAKAAEALAAAFVA